MITDCVQTEKNQTINELPISMRYLRILSVYHWHD